MTNEQIQQLVDSGAISEDTANYMRAQNAQMSQMLPQPALPPTGPDAGHPPDRWDSGAGGAQNQEPQPIGYRPQYSIPTPPNAGAGGGGGMGGMPPMPMGASGPPPMAEQSAPPPPLPPQGPVDPATLVMNRPPPVQGTEKPAARKPAAGVGGGPKAPSNPTSAYAQATMGNFDEQKRNLENRRDFEQVNASMRAAQMNEDLDALTAQDAQRAAQHKQYLQRSEAALADLNARADALSRGKVDPGHWISDDPMHAIAAVFLGMDSPVVQKMIDRDIQSQKDAYERNKDSYLARASNYGHLRELYKDDEMAANAARVLQIDRAQRKLAVMTASQQPEDISLKTQEAMTTLAQAREDADYKFKMSAYVAQQKAGAGAGGMPALFNSIFKGNADALRSAQEDYYKRNPQGNMLGFANEVAQANKGALGNVGGGGGGSRLGMAAERAGLGARALSEYEKAIDAGADRGWIMSKLSQVANSVGDAFGTEGSALRSATKKGASAEVAAALSGGSPTDTMLKEVGEALNTNDPSKAKSAIKHYRGMLEEAERRYKSRAGAGKYGEFLDDDEKER